jgi:hypothetical protein
VSGNCSADVEAENRATFAQESASLRRRLLHLDNFQTRSKLSHHSITRKNTFLSRYAFRLLTVTIGY